MLIGKLLVSHTPLTNERAVLMSFTFRPVQLSPRWRQLEAFQGNFHNHWMMSQRAPSIFYTLYNNLNAITDITAVHEVTDPETKSPLTLGSLSQRVRCANTAQGHVHEWVCVCVGTTSTPLLLQPPPAPLPVCSNSTKLNNNSFQHSHSVHLNMTKGLRVLWNFLACLTSTEACFKFELQTL